MDFEFFAQLSRDEAESFLKDFLTAESEAMEGMLKHARAEGLRLTLGVNSIRPLFEWIIKKVQSSPIKPDATLPRWLTTSESYERGLFAFDEASKIFVLRGAYFWGASFVKEYPQLSWKVGDDETALQNMPVVEGFCKNVEMPPMLIAENLLRRIHGRNAPVEIVDTAVEAWIAKI
jgi:hypothetical protein